MHLHRDIIDVEYKEKEVLGMIPLLKEICEVKDNGKGRWWKYRRMKQDRELRNGCEEGEYNDSGLKHYWLKSSKKPFRKGFHNTIQSEEGYNRSNTDASGDSISIGEDTAFWTI